MAILLRAALSLVASLVAYAFLHSVSWQLANVFAGLVAALWAWELLKGRPLMTAGRAHEAPHDR